ncbi:MAG: NAD(P)-dependent oxidoreductase [Planctomycetaceae bacterium]
MHKRPVVVIPGDDPPLVGRSQCLDQLRELADVRLYSDRPANDAEMLKRLKPADVLLNSRSAVKVSGEVLHQLPKLKMIAVCGIGYDSIDIEAASRRGIVVSNIPGRTATVVAEHAFGLMLAVSRRMASMTEQLRAGQWSAELGMSLIGKRIGVIGTGNIGSQMIRLCSMFGMESVAWTFHPDKARARELGFRYVSLEELFSISDVVSLHVRLSEETRGMISSRELQQMKRGSILINTARAAIVDTTALASSVNSGHLFGAGVDVYDAEPITTGNVLMKCRNVVLTPHSADQTPEGLDLLTQGCVENIRAFLEERPQNVVNL